MKLTIAEIRKHSTIAKAIEAKAASSDSIASGIIGSEFATSGPGPGYSRQHTTSDYARRAIEDGCLSYIDSADGREATIDKDGDLVWSDETVVELVAPDLDDVDANLETVERMISALDAGQCMTTRPKDWASVRALATVSEADVCECYDVEIVGDGIAYYDDASRRWYAGPKDHLQHLRELHGLHGQSQGYSLWCAQHAHADFGSQEEARTAAEQM